MDNNGQSDVPSWDKDPQAVKDYGIDWSDWLGSDTLVNSEWEAPGLTVVSSARTAKATQVVLSGGTAGTRYRVTNKITTASGNVDLRSIEIKVRNM